MKRIKYAFYIICCFAMLLSCNSNALKQELAEKSIREYLSSNRIETSKGTISNETIREIKETNVFTQFNTSVTVIFNNKEGSAGLTLLFIFRRTPKNKWFLTSIEEVDNPTQELSDWLKTKEKLNIPV